jgi:hypothetical protein
MKKGSRRSNFTVERDQIPLVWLSRYSGVVTHLTESGAILVIVQRSCVQKLALVIVSGLTLACSTPQVQRDKTASEVSDKTMAVPEFSIAVKLSKAAQNTLQEKHESVLVIADFDGDPLPGKGKDNSPMRGVVLGADEKLVDANNVATFSGTKISQGGWNDLASKDYYVTINVVSARKSSKNNLPNAFKRVVGVNPGTYAKRCHQDRGAV